MNISSSTDLELNASEAFSRQSAVFDKLYGDDTMIQYKRKRVRDHILKFLKPGSNLLELNCGTGADAIFFAGKGCSVHATDISKEMLLQLKEKIENHTEEKYISSECCSYTELGSLQNRGPFDHIYSNFGGLNCTSELDKVLQSLYPLLKSEGTLTMVVISKFCLWEFLLIFKGKFKTALRRFFSSSGRKAHIEGCNFTCWYYKPDDIRKYAKDQFKIVDLEGLCAMVPPSYIEGFTEKHPRAFHFLSGMENKWSRKWPWKNCGDYFIITLRKEPSATFQ